MGYTSYFPLADHANGDSRRSAEEKRLRLRHRSDNEENNRLDHLLEEDHRLGRLEEKHRDRDRDRRHHQQACRRSSGVGVTFTLSGTICPLQGEHNANGPPPEEDPSTSLEQATATAGRRRCRSRCTLTSGQDTSFRDAPPRPQASRDAYHKDDKKVGAMSLSLECDMAEPGERWIRCPTHRRSHQCPSAPAPAAPTRLSPPRLQASRDTHYKGDQKGGEISLSLGYDWAEPGTRRPTHSTPYQCSAAPAPAAPTRLSSPRSQDFLDTQYKDDHNGGETSLSLSYELGEPGKGWTRRPTHGKPHQCSVAQAPAASIRLSPRYGDGGSRQEDTWGSAGNPQQRRQQIPPHAIPTAHRFAAEETEHNSGAPSEWRLFRDPATSAVPPAVGSYVPRESVCEPLVVRDKSRSVSYLPWEEAAEPQRGERGASRCALDGHRGNPVEATAVSAAVPRNSVRSLQWNAHLEEARTMKHVSEFAYWGGFPRSSRHPHLQ